MNVDWTWIVSADLQNLENWIQLITIVALGGFVAWSVVRIYERKLSRSAILVRLFALELLVIGVCVGVDSLIDSSYPLIFAIIASAVLTFFGLLLHFIGSTPHARLEDRDVRSAIAASITVMYLVLVGYGVFIQGDGETQRDPLADSLMKTFSTVVGLVITFYFGSSAYLEGKRASAHSPKAESEPIADGDELGVQRPPSNQS